MAVLVGMVLLILPLCASAQHAGLKFYSLAEVLAQIQSDVTTLRELSPLSEVERQFITRDDLEEQLVAEIEDDAEAINITQQLLVFLDLMAEGQDLYTILLNIHSEEVLGFYDTESKELYVISGTEDLGPVEEVTFAHEYTHALQDQHFDLGSLLVSEDNSDISMAVDSLIEGDATLMTAIYVWNILTDSEREALFQESDDSEDEAFDAAPKVIQENFLFPYEAGLDFAMDLYVEGGWQAINEAYSDPPQSTEQILHPEKYLQRDEPQAVTMPDLQSALGAGWSQLDDDVLGELNIRIYLETFVDASEASKAAEGWDGDRYLFLKDTEGREVFVLHSVWDSIADAREFFDAYITFVENKSGGNWSLFSQESGKRWWKAEGLSVYLEQGGDEVLLIIAPDEDIAEVVRAELPELPEGISLFELPSWAWAAIGAGGAFILGAIVWRLVVSRKGAKPF